ncbi:hypothetical protein L2E82_03563 [Cichorium intybus]|uniref:Uncharacterized protein n=1 Tax=Cichorium intybus TaxID=13427 RepID=A0ACB9H585_CICIN|nr:hypothetical protein L2E82_03563 [Cichorium intybus]
MTPHGNVINFQPTSYSSSNPRTDVVQQIRGKEMTPDDFYILHWSLASYPSQASISKPQGYLHRTHKPKTLSQEIEVALHVSTLVVSSFFCSDAPISDKNTRNTPGGNEARWNTNNFIRDVQKEFL